MIRFNGGQLMTMEEFTKHVKAGGFNDYDGWGRYVTEDKTETTIFVRPSDIMYGFLDYPYVVWFNK